MDRDYCITQLTGIYPSWDHAISTFEELKMGWLTAQSYASQGYSDIKMATIVDQGD